MEHFEIKDAIARIGGDLYLLDDERGGYRIARYYAGEVVTLFTGALDDAVTFAAHWSGR